ncbi:hypothetical protein ACFLZW_06060 [Chloroflexota bacterium]
MKKSQIVGGVVCLVLAAFLEILAIVLPAEKVWFTIMVGGLNISIVSVILLIVGLVLLATPVLKKQER